MLKLVFPLIVRKNRPSWTTRGRLAENVAPGVTVTPISRVPLWKKSSRPSRDQRGSVPPSVETRRRSPAPDRGATKTSWRDETIAS
ncbi:MAG: hypothetical protein IPF66_24320 [Holophagales bacterium]|nr:hypothetical protein [Holophagales bacterium]